jgi:glutamate--cysteine ligase catalytic subunit
MGLLYIGEPLEWEKAKQHADRVRDLGITQFLRIWNNLKDRQGDELLWGDEVCRSSPALVCISRDTSARKKVEYMVISFDNEEKNAKLSLRQTEILEKLSSIVSDISSGCAE